MEKIVQIKKSHKGLNKEELSKLSQEELIDKIIALQAHNAQLQNLLSSKNEEQKLERKRKFDFTKCTFRHILLRIMYLGWDYQGFATQEETTNTIEYHLFQALTKTCLIKDRASSNYHRCGRTDKGVSSFGQTISLDIRSKLTEDAGRNVENEMDYCKILNGVLPSEIRCIAWAPTEKSFSSRFNCKWRLYKYYFPKGKLNIEVMNEAGKLLLGSHDFRNFCKMDVGNGVVKFVREILDFRVKSINGNNSVEEQSMYVAHIKANAFLWHQIRYIMGIMFLIGSGKEKPTIIKNLLNIDENPRKPQYEMASEVPLNLFHCEYDNVTWHYSQTNLTALIDTVNRIWTFAAIKETMIKDMLSELSKNLKDTSSTLLQCPSKFLQGKQPKIYVPLLKRQRCESLESKIEHYAKRNRIELVKTSTYEHDVPAAESKNVQCM